MQLAEHLALIREEYAAARAAPLSARQAMLVAVLLDKFADRLFAAWRAAPQHAGLAEDVLAYRAALAAENPALATVFGLCALRPGGPVLRIVDMAVPLADYGMLPVEDFMVSLYNGHAVQRVVIEAPDGSRLLVHAILGDAIAACATASLPPS